MSTAATETGETPAKHRYDERDRRLVLARVGVSVGALLIGAIAGLPQVMERAGRIRLPAGIDKEDGKSGASCSGDSVHFRREGGAWPNNPRCRFIRSAACRRSRESTGQGRRADDQRQAHSGRIGLSGRVQRVEGRLSARFGGPAGAASAPVHVSRRNSAVKRQMARNFRLRKPTHPFKSPIFRHGLTGDCGLSAARPQRKSVHLFRCVSLPKRASAGAAGPENGAFFRLFLLESREKRVDFFAAGTYNDAYK